MEPEEVAEIYKKQAVKLCAFMEQLKTQDFDNDDYKIMLLTICQCYYELLLNLSLYTPMMKVKFYKIKALDVQDLLKEPPFDKDFFNNHSF